MIFGVHTLILKHGLSFDQAAAILCYDRDAFIEEISRLKKNESRIFNLKAHLLIRKLDVAVTKAYNASFSIYLRMHVAPSDIVANHRTEAIFHFGMDKIAFYDGLNSLLDQLFGDYSFITKDCKRWIVNYIEYASNLYSSNVDLALEMLRKNTKDVKASYFKDGSYTLSVSKKAKHRRNSSTTVYNKAEAVKALHSDEYDELKDDVDGYIRFERQLGRAYLWNQIAKKDESKDNLDYYLDYKIAKRVLTSSYAKIFCIGDFYSLKRIQLKIHDKKLVEYAESATKSRSIKCTKIKAKNGKSAISTATNNSRIRAFDSMCIAPVAIPVRAHVDYLPNPIPLHWLPKDIGIKQISNDIENLVMNSKSD